MHRLIPLFPFGISGLHSHQSKHSKLADSSCIQLFLEFPAQLRIWDKNIGDHHTCKVKSFAWRSTGNGNVLKLFFHSGENLMLSLKHKVLVNLVTHHDHSMFHADISKLFQFFPGPHSSNRIVRIAQEKQLHMFLCNLLLQIRKINVIAVVLSLVKIAAYHFSAVVRDYLRERIVHRKLDQNAVPRLCVRLHRHSKGKHNARRLDQPLFLWLPVVIGFHPVCHDFKIRSLHLAVSENALFRSLHQRIFHVRRGLKIHICHPQRQHIRRLSSLYRKVIFQASGIFSVYDSVKIKISFRHLILPLFLQILSPVLPKDPVHPRFLRKDEGYFW